MTRIETIIVSAAVICMAAVHAPAFGQFIVVDGDEQPVVKETKPVAKGGETTGKATKTGRPARAPAKPKEPTFTVSGGFEATREKARDSAIRAAVERGHTSAEGPFSARAAGLLQEELGAHDILLTTSCTAALEMSALLLGVGRGDTVVVPSFGFVTTALAYARAGNPRYDPGRLRHRVAHAVRPTPGGGLTWKYDRAIREAVRTGRWRDGLDLWPLWKTLACPTLLVRGAESDILTDDIAQRMLAAQPRARLAEVAGAGHTVPGDRPAEFLAVLREFLHS